MTQALAPQHPAAMEFAIDYFDEKQRKSILFSRNNRCLLISSFLFSRPLSNFHMIWALATRATVAMQCKQSGA